MLPDYLSQSHAEHKLRKATMDEAAAEPVDVAGAIAAHIDTDLRLRGITMVQAWVETDDADLDADETHADRLLGLIAESVDEDGDDDLNDDELEALEVAFEGARDYMLSHGVSPEDADLLLDDADNDAALRVRDLLAEVMPDDEEALADAYACAAVGECGEETMDAVSGNKFGASRVAPKLFGKRTVGVRAAKAGARRVHRSAKWYAKTKMSRRSAAVKAGAKRARLKSKTGNALKLLSRSMKISHKIYGGRRHRI